MLVSSPEIRTRRRRATRAPYSPKVPLIAAFEAPQFLSQFEVEIEEVHIAEEVELIEEVQASEAELESIAIMSGFVETKGHS